MVFGVNIAKVGKYAGGSGARGGLGRRGRDKKRMWAEINPRDYATENWLREYKYWRRGFRSDIVELMSHMNTFLEEGGIANWGFVLLCGVVKIDFVSN